MSDWRPASGPAAAASRAALVRRLREYFDARGVLEVDTPALNVSAVSDAQLESFEIHASLVSNQPLYLHTSPEFHMKRLLAGGYPDIYSICRVFRDGEAGRTHQPEFTMVEWYRLGFGLGEIVEDTIELITRALAASAPSGIPEQYDYCEVFLEATGIDSRRATTDELADAVDADDQLRANIGDERDDWLDLLLATQVIPRFAPDRLTVLRHYPASQAALARHCPSDPDVADRFEVFIGQVELANGYVELTDAKEQSERITADNRNRERRGRPVRPVDQDLISALESGLPPCAGVALGLERLQMIHDKTDDMRNVITFAFEPNA